MADEVDTRISPTLHPDVSLQIEDYDEETRPVLGQTETAVSAAFEALKAIHDAKAAAATNKTLSPMAQLVQVDDYATKRMTPVWQMWDRAIDTLNNNINTTEKELRAPVEQKASQAMATEIRSYFRGLEPGARMKAIQQAINDGDEVTVSSVLGGKAYLVDLDPEIAASFLTEWNAKQKPLEAKRVRAMRAAADLLNGRVKLLKKAQTDAVGVHEETTEDRQGRTIVTKRWTPAEVREMVRKANLAFEVPVAR